MSGLETEQIRYAISVAQAKGYRQVKLGLGGAKFKAVLSERAHFVDEEPQESHDSRPAEVSPLELAVTATAVGYFRMKTPEPALGESIQPGDKVGEIIALGLANDVTAQAGGTVVDVCVADGAAVEFGQKLLVLRQSS